MGPIRLETGEFTGSEEECLNRLIEVHFPGFQRIPAVQEDMYQVGLCRRADWKFVASIVTVKKVEWAVWTVQPHKSPQADGVYPVPLQEGLEDQRLPLTKILRVLIVLGRVLMSWRGSRVVFLPKPGKKGKTTAKDFMPISLTSFISKVLESLVERYIRDRVLTSKPLHSGQHSFQKGLLRRHGIA